MHNLAGHQLPEEHPYENALAACDPNTDNDNKASSTAHIAQIEHFWFLHTHFWFLRTFLRSRTIVIGLFERNRNIHMIYVTNFISHNVTSRSSPVPKLTSNTAQTKAIMLEYACRHLANFRYIEPPENGNVCRYIVYVLG